jgi:hypothetical protein
MKNLPLPLPLAALLACSLPVSAQTLYGTLNGEKANDRFGWSVAGLGDVNLDGRPDFAVGAPEDGSAFLPGEGYVRVYSGLSGAALYTLQGTLSSEQFGADVESCPDLNGDGRPELLIGAPGSGPGVEGRVFVHSGANGALLLTLGGPQANDQIGFQVTAIGDLNLDGKSEILAGGAASPSGGTQRGVAVVYSGATGTALFTITGTQTNQRLGQSVAGVGDLNGDGRPDFLVGSMTGGARLYSGLNASVLRTYGTNGSDRFGTTLCALGDLNSDGLGEYAIGATQDGSVFAPDTGYVSVYSGASGALLYTVTGLAAGDRFASSLANGGDLNGDGKDDLLVGADQFSFGGSGYVQVLSGANGAVLYSFNGTGTGQRFGQGLDGLGDLNNDGRAELAIGVPARSPNFSLAGQVELWSRPAGCPAPSSYCSALPNSTGGSALMSYAGSASIAANNFQLLTSGAPANKLALYAYSTTQASTPAGNGILCLGSPFVRLPAINTTSTGDAGYLLNFGSLPAAGPILPGDTRHFVLWYRDPAAGGANFNFSNGLSVQFCP